jgi:hypothetical protein
MRKGQTPFDIDITGVKQLWIVMEDVGSYDPTRTVAGLAAAELVTANGTLKLADQPYLDKVPVQTLTVLKNPVEGVQVIPLGRTLIYNLEGLNATRLKGSVVVDDKSGDSDIGASTRLFVFASAPDHEQLVKVSGERPVPAPAALANRDQAIRYCYRAVLARDPSSAEMAIARRYLGESKIEAAALEDLLWSLLLHPEFQYIW